MEALLNFDQILTLILFCLWLLAFIFKPELRKEMFVLSIFSIFILPVTFILNPPLVGQTYQVVAELNFTSLVFIIATTGLAGVVFHLFTGKNYHNLPKIKAGVKKEAGLASQFWIIQIFLTLLCLTWGTTLLIFFFHISVAGGFLLSTTILTAYIFSHRQDLLLDAVWSGVLMAIIVFIISVIASVFVEADSTIIYTPRLHSFFGVPSTLLVWSLAVGLGLGPIYEYVRRLELS
ncbi:hypothetical protein COY25_01080 [Candidatus Uhrbacteria bacterium CG_4_10_14_0_2_um_filter_41_7]|uniref:Lycopene cyclase domain-containing protein n=1 Tax=Candidatus Uhrbacteria bacterium CG_4_9_14_3_um_filter_41_35 TaxID=1975034 RepID=A0A2M7XH98_9BACT|nr:MAG: hypothetical protein COV92_00505 [Candidatus Uhrbacteria bacterium CG11_big_fil_rev_8_21_14_0_20_41_9]PIZ55324.1 MAG: hypothetical protein COY25_01080 [Candidatus Uhrbacteria bacterium CG_4_10_14_0_2_um_filter_41_7]PJA47086.1 MAG: hypothetical protein CO173_00280 [Candidatus Uhrbacteria bacterium CG_4_9_14_3_um_filter_41_35]